MKGQVVGIKQSSFTAKETGEVITGTTIYFLSEDENVEGFLADRLFLTPRKLAHYQPRLKDIVDIQYNRFGKVDTITKVGEA